MYSRRVSHVDVYLTGRVEDHVLHYAFEVDGVKRRGNFSTASSELEASASAIYMAVKKTVEIYPNAGEISLHTDIEKPFGYLDGKYKPTTDTMKKFVRAVEKLKSDYNLTLQTDKDISKETADNLYNSAFGQNTSPKNNTEKKTAEQSKSVQKPAKSTSAASRWAKGAKAKQEQKAMMNSSPAYEPAKTSNGFAKQEKFSAPYPELEGEWTGWDERGVMMIYPTFDDAVNERGIPVYANGQTPPADSMGFDKPKAEQPKAAPKQNVGAGKGWMRKGVVLDENPLSAPKRELKSQAFENWHGTRTPKAKWGVMALNSAGEIIAEVSSRNLPDGCKKDAEYMADWWEQVEKYKVVREGLEKGKNDFSNKLDDKGNFKGFDMTVANKDNNSMIVWKDGTQIYNGGITDEYKRQYVDSHNDYHALQWAAELEAKKKAEEKAKAESKKEHYEQMNLFEFMQNDDPFSL